MKLLDRKNGNNIALIDEGSFCKTDTDLQMAEMDAHDYGTPQFPNNWMRSGEGRGSQSSFKISLQCKRLILIFKDSGSDEFGTADIRVDGVLVQKSIHVRSTGPIAMHYFCLTKNKLGSTPSRSTWQKVMNINASPFWVLAMWIN